MTSVNDMINNNFLTMINKKQCYEAQVLADNLKLHKPRRNLTHNKRQRILKRDRYCCVYCGSKENLQIHHKIPVSKGGNNSDKNLETICVDCHAAQHPEYANLIMNGKDIN